MKNNNDISIFNNGEFCRIISDKTEKIIIDQDQKKEFFLKRVESYSWRNLDYIPVKGLRKSCNS